MSSSDPAKAVMKELRKRGGGCMLIMKEKHWGDGLFQDDGGTKKGRAGTVDDDGTWGRSDQYLSYRHADKNTCWALFCESIWHECHPGP
eukprot:gene45076-60615_t